MSEPEDTSTASAAEPSDNDAQPKKPSRPQRKTAAERAPVVKRVRPAAASPSRRRSTKSSPKNEEASAEDSVATEPPPQAESEATPEPSAYEPVLQHTAADPQMRVETRVLTSAEMAALEARTAAIFGTPPREQAPVPSAEATSGTAEHHDAPTDTVSTSAQNQSAPPPESTEPPAESSSSQPPSPQPYPPRQSQHGFRRNYDQYGQRGDRDRDRDRGQFSGGGNRPPQQQGGNNPRQGAPYSQDGGGSQRNNAPDGSSSGSGGGFASRPAEPQFAEGLVEVSGKGFGFLRESKRNYVQTPADTFVTPEVCRRYNLRDGVHIKGEIRRSSRGPQLFRLTEIYGEDPEQFRNLPNFEELTTINPRQRIKLETVPERYTTRVMDLMTPIGKGQRGLIVAPPRTGKTTLLQHIGEAVVKNHPTMKLIILLVDERPEEVTEIRRAVPEADIMASSNDSDLKSHTRIATLAMDRAKRLVEAGKDVFILLDSITRVARAFNNAMGGGGRTGSGGLDVRAMEIPRKIFAAARNTEEAGSLTIMATALIETGSKMDEVIFQEFKGTGNMELVLDRKISDMRVYPAVDIFLSGTRREELLLQEWELHKINVIRRGLAGHKPIEAIERLLSILKKFPTNAQMLTSLPG